jgi:hypothetical protein
MRGLLDIIKQIVSSIINVFIKIYKRWFCRDHTEHNATEQYDNTCWVEVKNKRYIDNSNDIDDTNQTDMDALKDYYYMSENHQVTIVMKDNINHFAASQICKTDPTNRLTLAEDQDFVCLYPTVKINNTKTRLFTGHTMMLMMKIIDEEFTELNPQVYITPKAKTTMPVGYFKKYHKATIMTIECATKEYRVIDTHPTTHINVILMDKGKPKMGTIALVFTICVDDEYIWSGSIVLYQKHVYIISNKTVYNDGDIIKLVAFSIGSHPINIVTE